MSGKVMMNRPDRIVFRVLLINSSSGRILGSNDHTRNCSLPVVFIPRWSRVAEQLQAGIQKQLGVTSLVLDVASGDQQHPPLVVAQALEPSVIRLPMDLDWTHRNNLAKGAFRTSERGWVERLLSSGVSGRGIFSRLNWISEVVEWVHSSTPFAVSEVPETRQLNASGDSALLCLKTNDGRRIWFKSDPREFGISRELSARFPFYLPTCFARHGEWRAWLMEDAGRPMKSSAAFRHSVIAQDLARLQIESSSQTEALLSKGFQDLRPGSLRRMLPDILEQVYRSPQSSLWAQSCQPVSQSHMKRAQSVITSILDAWEDLQIPDTLCHGDLNLGNVLLNRTRCVFIDWREAAVGIPFVNFIQMRLQLSQAGKDRSQGEQLSNAYLGEWSSHLAQRQLQGATRLMPLVEIVTRLSSRHLWMSSRALSPTHVMMYSHSMIKMLDSVVSGSERRLIKAG